MRILLAVLILATPAAAGADAVIFDIETSGGMTTPAREGFDSNGSLGAGFFLGWRRGPLEAKLGMGTMVLFEKSLHSDVQALIAVPLLLQYNHVFYSTERNRVRIDVGNYGRVGVVGLVSREVGGFAGLGGVGGFVHLSPEWSRYVGGFALGADFIQSELRGPRNAFQRTSAHFAFTITSAARF
jgi:hypothetical protein